MTSRDFCYWLQRLLEVGDPKALNEKQIQIIKNHLAMVFVHEIDPSFPSEQQTPLNNAHQGTLTSNYVDGLGHEPGMRC